MGPTAAKNWILPTTTGAWKRSLSCKRECCPGDNSTAALPGPKQRSWLHCSSNSRLQKLWDGTWSLFSAAACGRLLHSSRWLIHLSMVKTWQLVLFRLIQVSAGITFRGTQQVTWSSPGWGCYPSSITAKFQQRKDWRLGSRFTISYHGGRPWLMHTFWFFPILKSKSKISAMDIL